MDNLEEARAFLRTLERIDGKAETPTIALVGLSGILNALIAMAERLPAPVEWRCCKRGYIWKEPMRRICESPFCPKCAGDSAVWLSSCLEECDGAACKFKPQQEVSDEPAQ